MNPVEEFDRFIAEMEEAATVCPLEKMVEAEKKSRELVRKHMDEGEIEFRGVSNDRKRRTDSGV